MEIRVCSDWDEHLWGILKLTCLACAPYNVFVRCTCVVHWTILSWFGQDGTLIKRIVQKQTTTKNKKKSKEMNKSLGLELAVCCLKVPKNNNSFLMTKNRRLLRKSDFAAWTTELVYCTQNVIVIAQGIFLQIFFNETFSCSLFSCQ